MGDAQQRDGKKPGDNVVLRKHFERVHGTIAAARTDVPVAVGTVAASGGTRWKRRATVAVLSEAHVSSHTSNSPDWVPLLLQREVSSVRCAAHAVAPVPLHRCAGVVHSPLHADAVDADDLIDS